MKKEDYEPMLVTEVQKDHPRLLQKVVASKKCSDSSRLIRFRARCCFILLRVNCSVCKCALHHEKFNKYVCVLSKSGETSSKP